MSALTSAATYSAKPAYFEFLLKPSLLEEHLRQSNAGNDHKNFLYAHSVYI